MVSMESNRSYRGYTTGCVEEGSCEPGYLAVEHGAPVCCGRLYSLPVSIAGANHLHLLCSASIYRSHLTLVRFYDYRKDIGDLLKANWELHSS